MTNPQRKFAYGETKAPADVDTLRDESCPICSESDSYDGNECQVCGYVAPPKPFRDPDVDLARTLDLRKQVDESQGDFGGTNTGQGVQDDSVMNPDQAAEFAQEQDQAPMDPDQLDETDARVPVDVRALDADGSPVPTNVAEEDVEENPIDPENIAEQNPGNFVEDAERGAQDQQGASLICPICGLNVPSAGPLTSGDNATDPENDGAGLVAGAPCPNCGKGALMQENAIMSMQSSRRNKTYWV